MGLNILITGANGFIGRACCNAFSKNKEFSVTATDISSKKTDIDCIRYIQGDCSDEDFLEILKALDHFDVIIHLAGMLTKGSSYMEYKSLMRANVDAVGLMLRLAEKNRARFILPSTAMVYGQNEGPFCESMPLEPCNFYAFSKVTAENLVRYYNATAGIPYVILRLGIVYGPGQRGNMFIPSLIESLVSKKEFPMTAGEQLRDFVYIDDLVSAIKLCAGEANVNGEYNISGGIPRQLIEVAQISERISGSYGHIKPGALQYRENEIWKYCLEGSKFRLATGWQPRVNIEEGLQCAILEMKEGLNK